MKWQVQQAKARFSEVINFTLTEGPQFITKRGEDCVVIISKKKYEELCKPQGSFIDFINSSPLKGVELEIERDPSFPREVDLGLSN